MILTLAFEVCVELAAFANLPPHGRLSWYADLGYTMATVATADLSMLNLLLNTQVRASRVLRA